MTNTKRDQLEACMYRGTEVPTALVQTTCDFAFTRQQWQYRKIASPGSLCEISFQVVNLYASIRKTNSKGPKAFLERASNIDADLRAWAKGLPLSWRFIIFDTPSDDEQWPHGRRHLYTNLWIAEAWNSWRVLRILSNQVVRQIEQHLDDSSTWGEPISTSVVRQCSIEICISTASLKGSPRASILVHRVSTSTDIFYRLSFPRSTIVSCSNGRVKYSRHSELCYHAASSNSFYEWNQTGPCIG